MKIFRAAVVAVSVWCAPTNPAFAQTKLTPGTAALLIEPQADLNKLRDGIADSDPIVRAVTARIAGLLNRTELVDGLLQVLAREQDAIAAREQVRALLYLRGELLPEIRAAATRLGAVVRSASAEWLARTHPQAFAATLPVTLRDVSEPEARTVGLIAAMAVRQTPGDQDQIAGALAGAGSSHAWREFLDRGNPNIDTNVSSLKAGLSSSNAAVREATIWFVVSGLASGRSLPIDDLKSAFSAPDATLVAEESEWAAFGRELLARRFGKSTPADGTGVIQRHALTNSRDARAVASARELTPDERTALRGVFPDLPPPAKGTRWEPKPLVDDPKFASIPMRTLTSFAPGFLSSLLAATKCTLPSNSEAFGAARISYRPDGRPGAAEFETDTLEPACALFFKSLATLAVPQQDQPIAGGVPHWLYMAMDKDALNCADEGPSPSPGELAHVGGNIKPPHKTKDMRPVYPRSMLTNRVEGFVRIEATISASGCVADATVTRGVEIPLDLAALRAVLRWRFTPTLVDEKPVPVGTTLTVLFTVR
jgi:TonB family protein